MSYLTDSYMLCIPIDCVSLLYKASKRHLKVLCFTLYIYIYIYITFLSNRESRINYFSNLFASFKAKFAEEFSSLQELYCRCRLLSFCLPLHFLSLNFLYTSVILSSYCQMVCHFAVVYIQISWPSTTKTIIKN